MLLLVLRLVLLRLLVLTSPSSSYDGSLLSVKHSTAVTLSTQCCITDPAVEIPIYVGASAMAVAVAVPLFEVAAAAVPSAPMWQSEKWAPTVTGQVVNLDFATAVLGGDEADGEKEEGVDVEQLKSVAQQGTPAAAGSLLLLQQKMERTFDDLDCVRSWLADGASGPACAAMSDAEFGSTVGEVDYPHEQPAVAAALAEAIKAGGGAFTAGCIANAVGKAAQSARTDVVAACAPLCADLAANVETIQAGLSAFECIVCETVLGPAPELLGANGEHAPLTM